MLNIALKLQAYGLPIHPLYPREKRPALVNWQNREPKNADEVQDYWSKHPTANVGLICGSKTGFVALDLDGDAFVQWALDNLPPTPLRTISGSGRGGHMIYRWQLGVPVAKRMISVDGLADSHKDKSLKHVGGDFYGDGSQIVLPGSVHPDGGVYRWAFDGDLPPLESVPFFDLAWLPQLPHAAASIALLPAVAPLTADSDRRLQRAAAYMAKRDPAVQGNSGNRWTYITCAVLTCEFGLSDADAWPLLSQWNQTCLPPWTERELRKILASARKHGKGQLKVHKQFDVSGTNSLKNVECCP